MDDSCKTKYPIMLIHGTGFRDFKRLNYWGRIPGVLESKGAKIYYGYQDSWGSIQDNAEFLHSSIAKIIGDTGCEKLNLIAHSKGGLDARYMISSCGMADKIASLTTIATPHHGSKTMDKFYRFPDGIYRFASCLVNLWFRILGDKKPDFYAASRGFSTDEAKLFNEQTPDSEGVYYQSYAAVMKNSYSDIMMLFPHFIINLIEGENDGLVTPASAAWTNFRGVLRGSTNRGISHVDEIDLRRRRLSKAEKAECVSDITVKYVEIVSELKSMGY